MNFGFRLGLKEGSLPWIPLALATLRPATSPHLSDIRLDFASSSTVDRSVGSLIELTRNDLRRVADEVSRIKGEFNGVVGLTVGSDPVFGAVLDAFNVRSYLYGVGDIT